MSSPVGDILFSMTYSIFFCSGLALGFTAGIVTWALTSYMAKKLAESAYKAKMMRERMDIMASKKNIDDKLAKIREANPGMTREQERIAEEELSKVFSSRSR